MSLEAEMGSTRTDIDADQHRPLGPFHSAESASTLTHGQEPAYFIRVEEAAEITGLPASLIRKRLHRGDEAPQECAPSPAPHADREVGLHHSRSVAWLAGDTGRRDT